jgi:hypothetical protein
MPYPMSLTGKSGQWKDLNLELICRKIKRGCVSLILLMG